jgi:hypothetical protein
MSFFSWFRSKSDKSEHDELELKGSDESPESHAGNELPPFQTPRVPPPRLRETVPGSRPKSASSAEPGSAPKEGFRRPVRATVDVPLQVLLLQLPPEVTKSNIDIDPKRRVQIPRKSLQIDDAHHTAKVTFATIFASCPEIFSVPIAPLDQRTLEFSLPAWERSRITDSGEQTTSPTAITPTESPTVIPPETREPVKVPDRLPPLPTQQLLGEAQPVPIPDKPEKAPLGGAARNGSEVPKTVRVALGPIIKTLPSELQPSDPNALAHKPGATIELPLELVNSQLANGRVTIPFSTFLKSLPEDMRKQFPQADTAAEISIPVKEILQDYPQDLLRPRADQEPAEVLPAIATPFTGPAKEDTERFAHAPEEAVPEKAVTATDSHQLELIEHAAVTPSESPQPVSQQAPFVEEKRDIAETPLSDEKLTAEQKPAPNFSALQSVFLTDEPLDLNKVVQKVAEFPGINSALFFAADGSIEGQPEKLGLTQSSVQLLSSLAHEVGQRVGNLGFGQIETVTLGWKRELVSVFTRGESGFLVRHEKRPFKPGVREKICLVLSHICS